MKSILLLTAVTFIASILPFTANAQTKTMNTDAPTKPTITQTAITKDGRNVLLNSDGTWKYNNNVIVDPTVHIKENSTLKIETGIVLRSGDVKPVSRKTFYLLDKSFSSILMSIGFSESSEVGYGQFLMEYFNSRDVLPQYRDRHKSALSALKQHVIKAVSTDFGGKATFEKLPTGTYWLMGVTSMNKSCVIWDTKVNLSIGDNSLMLDQNNSAEFIDGNCLLE